MNPGWAAARDLLCIRLDSMGDVLMSTPAIRALKEALPGRRITLLTSPGGAQAARFAPDIDDVLEFQAPWMKVDQVDPLADAALVQTLRARRFDAAVVFTVYSQNPLPSAYLAYLAGIPLRLAYCRENPYHLLSDWLKEREPETMVRHEVRRQLDLVAAVGCSTQCEGLSFRIPEAARKRVAKLLRAEGMDEDRRLVIAHPGASAASRRYPAGLFARALDMLAQRAGCELALTGDACEVSLVDSVRASMRTAARSLAGRLGIDDLAALLDQAALLVSNNTGPVHLAAAVGTPVVDLYALTNPQHAPWQVPHRVLYHDVACRYCYRSVCPAGHHECLTRVAPEAVAQAACELLAGDATIEDARNVLPAARPSRRRGELLFPDAVASSG